MLRYWTIITIVLVLILGGKALTADSAPELTSGQDLYKRLSCWGCHVLEGRGGDVGPALDGAGSRLSRQELETQLQTPRRRQHDSRMPSFAFVRPHELQSLLDFLATLQ